MSDTAPFEPSEEQLRLAKAMSGFGLPDEDIAVLVEVDLLTLHRHFHHVLKRGAAEGTAKVAQTLFQMATVEKNVSAVIFWMKARAGWREKHEVQVVENPLEKISDEELAKITNYLKAQIAAEEREAALSAPRIVDATYCED